MKLCPVCGVQRTPENTWLRDGGRLQAYCKRCHKAKMDLNRMLAKAQGRDWYTKNKGRNKASSMKSLYKRKYGVTQDQVNEAIRAAGHKCEICGSDIRFGQKGRRKAVVDHCHKSGKFRAVICMSCNSAIGLLDDQPETARNAALYLERHRAHYQTIA